MTDVTALQVQLAVWRRDLHAHPEFGFEEKRTAAFVANTLRGFGIEVAEGIGGTVVVGTLQRGTSNRVIALRADMDALRISIPAYDFNDAALLHGAEVHAAIARLRLPLT